MPAFVDDVDVYLDDFGDTVVSGVVLFDLIADVDNIVDFDTLITGLGILDQPGIIEQDGVAVVSTDYRLTCKTSQYGTLVYNNLLTVAGVGYTVRDTRIIGDGLFCQIMLSKV